MLSAEYVVCFRVCSVALCLVDCVGGMGSGMCSRWTSVLLIGGFVMDRGVCLQIKGRVAERCL